MTCIVGIVDGAKVWIGGDSAASAGCQRFPHDDADRKVFRRGDMLLGACGPSRVNQILKHLVEIPEHPDGMPTFAYLVKHLMPAVRAAIVEYDGAKINDPQDGWEFLLGYRGGLYSICHDLSVTVLPAYGAVGCGHMIALGALYASSAMIIDPKDRVHATLDAAAEHDIHVARPFTVESV